MEKYFLLQNERLKVKVANCPEGYYDSSKFDWTGFTVEILLDDKYQIVLVGTDDNVDGQLPDRILSIHCTQNQTELAEIYSAADIFVNPTREDTYPTVNLEAQACGTPCITYRTGGSPESVPEENVVEQGDLEAIVNRIYELCK